MKKIISTLLLSLPLLHTAQAADTNSGCGHFHLQISNLTDVVCVLTSQQVVRGNLISSPPTTIMPNDSKVFDMEQTVYGPGITLSYQCGEEIISFTSKQNLCVLEAGDITGSILHPMPVNLNASYTAITGSYFWDKPGSINWRIFKQKK